MAIEPITQSEYERELAMLEAMKAPPAAYEELESRPRVPDPPTAEDIAELDAAIEELEAEAELEPDEPRRLIPTTVDRTEDVQAVYDRTRAAILEGAERGDFAALADAIAYLVSTIHVAELPERMDQFSAVLDQLQAVFGSGKAGGMLGRMLKGRG